MQLMAAIGFILLIPVIIILASLWNGWGIWIVWNWWAPVIGEWVPALSYAASVGMAALVGLFTHHLVKQDTGGSDMEKAGTALVRLIVAPPIIVASNWLILAVLV